MWRTTKTAAGKLRGSERVSVTSASTPPAEAPTTIMSCPGIFPPRYGKAVLFSWQHVLLKKLWDILLPSQYLTSNRKLCFYKVYDRAATKEIHIFFSSPASLEIRPVLAPGVASE